MALTRIPGTVIIIPPPGPSGALQVSYLSDKITGGVNATIASVIDAMAVAGGYVLPTNVIEVQITVETGSCTINLANGPRILDVSGATASVFYFEKTSGDVIDLTPTIVCTALDVVQIDVSILR